MNESRQHRIRVHNALNIFRVYIRTHDGDRAVLSAIDIKKRQIPAGITASSLQLEKIDIVTAEPLLHVIKSDHAALVLDVVPYPRRQGPWLADRHNDLFLNDLNQVVKRVVLEQHRQPLIPTEQCLPQGDIFKAQLSDHHGQWVFPPNTDLKIGGTIPGKYRLGILQQVVTQAFGHPFPAEKDVDRVVLPVEPSFLYLIHQILQKRRVAVENVGILVPEEAHGVQ